MQVPRDDSLEAKALAVGRRYDARMTEIMQNLRRAPADVRFCKTCNLVNKWPIAVSEMSIEEYQRHTRDDLNEALELLARDWDPRDMDRNLPEQFDPSGDDTFSEEQKAAADEHRAFCPIREVDGWRTDVTQTYHVGDYWDRFVDATSRGDDIMSLVGEDNYGEFVQPRLSRAQIAASQRYFNRKALAAQVLLKHCPKCLRASSTALMGKRMHERVCQLARSDWVTLAEVQPLRTQEGVDGREMVMNSNGLLERRFRIFAPSEKARLERKYQLQLYAQLNLDEKSLALLGDDNDSEDVPSDQDDRLIARRRGPPRRRPHRNPIDSENSDDENDYGPGRGGGRIIHRRMPTLEEYNSWRAMAPTLLNINNNSTEQISSRFEMEFQDMLQRNDPIAASVPEPQTSLPHTVRPLPEKNSHPWRAKKSPRTKIALDTGEITTGQLPAKTAPLRGDPRPPAPDPSRPDDARKGGDTNNVGTGRPLGTKIPALPEADTERPLDLNPTPALQRAYDEMPEAFISAVTETGLLDDPIAFSERVLTLRLLRTGWDVQNARAAGEAARKRKRGRREAAEPDARSPLLMYVDFFTEGGLTSSPTPVSFLEILRYSDARLERDNSYIPFLFPVESASEHNPSAPPMPAGFRQAMIHTQGFLECCMLGVRRMMAFWGFQHRGTSSTGRHLWRLAPNFVAANHTWTRNIDHNHLRVSRVIRFLRLAGAHRIARSIYRCMMRAIRERNLPVDIQTWILWRRRALGPVGIGPLSQNFPPDRNYRTDSEPGQDDRSEDKIPNGLTDDSLSGRSHSTGDSSVRLPRLWSSGGPLPEPRGNLPTVKWGQLSPPFGASFTDDDIQAFGNGGDLGEVHSSSSSEGFLDPHERDEDFIPKRLPISPVGSPVAVHVRAPLAGRDSYESVPKRDEDYAAINTRSRTVPGTRPQETQQPSGAKARYGTHPADDSHEEDEFEEFKAAALKDLGPNTTRAAESVL
ncbi:unnamed protein product [Tuber aestivum]|uniref:Opioid growth factor receptor (OGFr) conserved domain-containing protein n=1 Tax=Tuber aestivum TaxID=59557 RepID=A0A292PT28_9PEZI|nr:unnamed protein product [Tuber aestivum]